MTSPPLREPCRRRPSPLRLTLAHARLHTLTLLRLPGFTVATVCFPTLLFVLFGLPAADGGARANVLVASFAAFAVLGVGLFQFGVSLAVERETPWHAFVRTLPAPTIARLGGRALSALVFAGASAAVVIGTGLATTATSLGVVDWLRLVATLLVGSIPFVALGLAVAYWTTPRAALPVANVVYLLLSYTGGLWTGPTDLPHVVTRISPYTPTRQWGDVIWPCVLGRPWHASHWLALVGYAVAFGLLAAWGHKRDEGQRYS